MNIPLARECDCSIIIGILRVKTERMKIMAIKDKVVIITGASSGIGEATARLLASKGAKLVLGARREEHLRKLVDEIVQAGGEAVYHVTDVTKIEDNKKLVDLAKEKFGRVDVIFLNAGVMPNSPLSKLKTKDWHLMVDVNIKGVLNGIEAVLPEFVKQKSGHVITTSSVAGLKAYPGGAVYGATKWAVRDLMEVLRMESAMEGTNIRTATIYPAAINTELLETISDDKIAKDMGIIYKQYGISPDRVANVVAFAIDQPEDTNVNEFTIGPTIQPW
ncbi:short-chain dehydrogenase/reductase sdr [Trichococcus collinsii]|uniref:Short chain dehydrogenase n=2 Tax=Trichococcus collinsii TaxID=157076 RepID=A0AB38A2N7_9LACT|nr:short-chain dehydrogenase/reductase sdr [Trichococcus collinsii]SEA81090.1 short chain dehydrogenase [Trichococcus collinsii]